ncbi:phytoene desaturase family protein [Streptomyces radiopugnans]|uniref:Phytoene dehydrogenase-related protein n=2 Tax=Streptomyces TaxID=1883 RepID=A0A1H8ZUM3_9ACTN|nr:NAD(P)/FAD-dependent oxidoreductase [Streptomyces radiopugnans]SEP68162.1 Phytoene dehydrogenase-related protein [Streptomyces radiopugnans]
MARTVVIGAGMGAMAAAARLAVAGHRVTVYERAGTHGGAVRRLERDGFGFDTGPGLLYLPAVWRDLFVKTGREPLEECVALTEVDPAVRHVFADGTSVRLPGGSRAGTVDALDAAIGAGAGERWSELLGRGRRTWEATRRPLLEEPLTAAGDRAPLGRDPYPAPRRGLLRRRAPFLSEIARSELRDPRLVALLESHALAHGLDPRRTPASAAVLPYLEQTFGTWYVGGGMRALADAVYERCLARGVEFRFGTAVSGITVEGGRATGVELADGRRAEADAVVCGIDPRPMYGGRASAADGGPGYATGRLTVLLALRGARPEGTVHRTVVHTGGPGGTTRVVTVLRPGDPALVPDAEHESAVLSVTVPPHRAGAAGPPAGRTGAGGEDGGAVDWTAPGAAERAADEALAAADAAGLGLGGRVLWREVRTPADTERETGAPGGAVPAPALAGADGAFLRAANSTGTAGLYRVGGSAHPGGGLAHAGMSGALAAGLIVEGDDWRGSR